MTQLSYHPRVTTTTLQFKQNPFLLFYLFQCQFAHPRQSSRSNERRAKLFADSLVQLERWEFAYFCNEQNGISKRVWQGCAMLISDGAALAAFRSFTESSLEHSRDRQISGAMFTVVNQQTRKCPENREDSTGLSSACRRMKFIFCIADLSEKSSERSTLAGISWNH